MAPLIKAFSTLFVALMGTGAIYLSNDYFEGQMTKYDRGLVEYMEGGGKIKFKIQKMNMDGRTSEITTFPSFTPGDISPLVINLSLSTSDSDAQLTDSTEGEGGKRNQLRGLNGGGRDWTWRCTIKFHRYEDGSLDANELIKHRRDAIKNDGTADTPGFFDKLQDPEGNIEAKRNLIRNCAHARGAKINRRIDSFNSLDEDGKTIRVSNQIDSIKDFQLVNEKSRSDPHDILVFKYPKQFYKWFVG